MEDVGIARGEHLLVDARVNDGLDLLRTGPDIRKEDRRARIVEPERLGREVDVHRARDGIGHDEGWRRKVVHLDVGVDAALEVAIATQHRDHGKVRLVDRGAYLGDERSGVTNAHRAAVAHGLEAQLVEEWREPRPVVVVGHHLRPGAEGGLNPRFAGQAPLNRLLGEQASPHHDGRVRGVRAGRNRRDDHCAVTDLHGLAVDLRLHRRRRFPGEIVEGADEGLLRLAQRNPVLGSLGARE